jgi:tRNA A-37 threonylcarbamoyl transferase component Bud32
MESQGFVFLFIQEESKVNTGRRIMKFEEVLNTLKMEAKIPNENENCLTLINDMKYKPTLIIVNIGHPFLEQIIQTSQKVRQFIPIILIYTSKTFNELKKIEEKYGLKYELEKSKINILEFRVLYEQIKTSSQFTQNEENKRYSYIMQIGSGTTGTVHLVHDTEKNRKVAMKKIDSSEMKDTEKERVQKEVENMKSMKIPTFIEFYDYENDNDTQKIYMEYADQGTLENKIAKMKNDGKDFTNEEIFDYLIDILLALYTLNKKGIVHRDIKSENILLKTDQINDKNVTIAKLSDLGLGRQIEGVSGAYTTCGTAYYVCPEIAAGEKKYSYNADIWSLGIVLYELIVKNKPWFDPKMSTTEFFEFVVSTKYPPLPENTDERLKYLVKIMLKKDPDRRPACEDILTLDFMYEKTVELIKKCNWTENETFKNILEDLKSKTRQCYLFVNLLSEKNNLLLKDARKISEVTDGKDYKVGYFSKGYKNTKNGEDLLENINELKTQGEINYKEETPNDLLSEFLSKGIFQCVSHTINDIKDEEEINKFIEDFLEKPGDYVFKIPFGDFDSYSKIDNQKFTNIEPEKKIDFLILSQYILKTGLNLCKDYIKDQTLEIDNIIYDKRYIEFKYGISLFNDCDIADIPYKDSKLKKTLDRLAFLLNLYQIMFLDYTFNTNLNNIKTKGGVLSFLAYDIGINYQFKDMTLNHLEIKHVIFRNNKPVPGSYLRLVYQSDKKCTFLPNFENHKPLFFLLDFNQDITLFNFKVFLEKEVDAQLNDVTLKFILNNINLVDEEELVISSHIKLIVTDFGANNTADVPEGFLHEILKILKTQRDFLANNKKYKLKLGEDKLKELEYLNQKLVREIADGVIRVSYA